MTDMTETPDSPEQFEMPDRIWLPLAHVEDAATMPDGHGEFIEWVRADTRPAPAWQDISTAPQNRYILLGYEQQGDEMPKGLMVGVGAIYDSGKLWVINAEDNEKAWPSSWMPLPAAPGAALSPAPVEGLDPDVHPCWLALSQLKEAVELIESDPTGKEWQRAFYNIRFSLAALAAYEERRDG